MKRKTQSPSLSPSDFAYFLHLNFDFDEDGKEISHKQLTCLQQNSEDTHRAGSPQKFLEMDFHRSQASTDHRKVLSCCADKPVRHGKKNLFRSTVDGFSAPEGSLQESACRITSKERAMKNTVEL